MHEYSRMNTHSLSMHIVSRYYRIDPLSRDDGSAFFVQDVQMPGRKFWHFAILLFCAIGLIMSTERGKENPKKNQKGDLNGLLLLLRRWLGARRRQVPAQVQHRQIRASARAARRLEEGVLRDSFPCARHRQNEYPFKWYAYSGMHTLRILMHSIRRRVLAQNAPPNENA